MARSKPSPPVIRHQVVQHKRQNIEVLAKDITTTHNPRWPMPELQRLGYVPIELFKNWVTNGTQEQRMEYVDLIDGNCPDIAVLGESMRMGHEQRDFGQLQAVILRKFRVKVGTEVEDDSGDERNVYETRYGMIAGERRLGGNRYIFAKYGLDLPLMAIAIECTKEDAYEMAIEENANRKPPNDLEWGSMYLWYHEHKQRIAPNGDPMVGDDGEPIVGWPISEIAKKFGEKDGYVRGRMACAMPGKLTPEQINDYMDGKIKITRLVEIATGQKPYRNPLEPHHRRGVRTLAEVRKRFDDLIRDGETSGPELLLLAWTMLYPTNAAGKVTAAGLKEAIQDSKNRIAEEERKGKDKKAREAVSA